MFVCETLLKMKPKEVLLTTESSGQLWNIMAWDPNNGSQLTSYRGGVSAPRTLSFIGNDYLISAERSKPMLHVWALHRKDQLQFHTVMPTLVTALSANPDGRYCAGAVGEQVNVWEVSTGKLQAVLNRHYQTVNLLKWTDDSSHLISAGEDGIVMVWLLQQILSSQKDTAATPRHTWSNHSLPVTDLHVGRGGWRARVITCSLDNTCKVFSIASGQLLLSIELPASLTSIAVLPDDSAIFAGTLDGNIYQVDVTAPPRTLTFCPVKEELDRNMFTGHSKRVTCLDVDTNGKLLASGSDDDSVIFWDIESKQGVRTLSHQGAIGNLMFCLAPSSMLTSSNSNSYSVCIRPFKRIKETASEGDVVNEKLEDRLDRVWGKHEDREDQEEEEEHEELMWNNYKMALTKNELYNEILDKITDQFGLND